jgi:organic radical activating enzyme
MLYKNGNTLVMLCPNGTKLRHIPDGEKPQPVKPESIDIKITDCCLNNCWFCYERSNSNGKHGDLYHPVLDTLESGTELAIGGGNPLLHPQLESFLRRMLVKGIVCNLTVHQNDYTKNKQYIDWLVFHGLVKGLGISVGNNDIDVQIPDNISSRVIFHTIIGITPLAVIEKLSQHCKVLLLGNKTQSVSSVIIDALKNYIIDFGDIVKGLYFDNLACKQLNIQSFVDDDVWKSRYMGGDGVFTMFIDLVQERCYSSSVDRDIGFSLLESSTIRDLFSRVCQSLL